MLIPPLNILYSLRILSWNKEFLNKGDIILRCDDDKQRHKKGIPKMKSTNADLFGNVLN